MAIHRSHRELWFETTTYLEIRIIDNCSVDAFSRNTQRCSLSCLPQQSLLYYLVDRDLLEQRLIDALGATSDGIDKLLNTLLQLEIANFFAVYFGNSWRARESTNNRFSPEKDKNSDD